jgi:hypothetical protein
MASKKVEAAFACVRVLLKEGCPVQLVLTPKGQFSVRTATLEEIETIGRDVAAVYRRLQEERDGHD